MRPGRTARFDVVRYGALPYEEAEPERYPLFAVKTKDWSASKPSVLVTGGIHGQGLLDGARHVMGCYDGWCSPRQIVALWCRRKAAQAYSPAAGGISQCRAAHFGRTLEVAHLIVRGVDTSTRVQNVGCPWIIGLDKPG